MHILARSEAERRGKSEDPSTWRCKAENDVQGCRIRRKPAVMLREHRTSIAQSLRDSDLCQHRTESRLIIQNSSNITQDINAHKGHAYIERAYKEYTAAAKIA